MVNDNGITAAEITVSTEILQDLMYIVQSAKIVYRMGQDSWKKMA
jgi:GTP-dependent phosphoenolpyruvate carboxykinase